MGNDNGDGFGDLFRGGDGLTGEGDMTGDGQGGGADSPEGVAWSGSGEWFPSYDRMPTGYGSYQ